MRLKEMSPVKQVGRKGETEKVKQPIVQKKRTCVARQATQTQPLLLAADAFAAALEAIPAEDWCRTWAAGRTIMLRRTSKRVEKVVDKMRLKLQFVMRQLTLMTAWCRMRTLISASIAASDQPGQTGLQECWDSAGRSCT